MSRELTRFEIAACKRVAANTKALRAKSEKLSAKIEELINARESIKEEISMWEAPIVEKFGYTVDEILSGAYLQPCNCGELPPTDDEENVEHSAKTFETYNTL